MPHTYTYLERERATLPDEKAKRSMSDQVLVHEGELAEAEEPAWAVSGHVSVKLREG